MLAPLRKPPGTERDCPQVSAFLLAAGLESSHPGMRFLCWASIRHPQMGPKEQCDLTWLWEQADLRQAMVFSMGNMSVAAQAGMTLSVGWESCSNS